MQWPQSQFYEIKCSREEQSPIWYNLFWCKRCVLTSSYLCSDSVEEGTRPVFPLWTPVSSQFLTPFYWQLRVWVHLCFGVCVCMCVIQLCVAAENIVFWFYIGAWILFYVNWSVSSELGSLQIGGQLNGALWDWRKPMTTLVLLCSLSPSCAQFKESGSACARKW